MAIRYLPKFYNTIDNIKKNFIKEKINIIQVSHDDEIVYRIQCYLGVTNDVAQKIVESYFDTLNESLFNNLIVKMSFGHINIVEKNKKISINFRPININNYGQSILKF